MVHYTLRNNAQEQGSFTDLFILGSFRKFNATTKVWGSDFTGGADAFNTDTNTGTTATYNLLQLTETLPAVTALQAAVPRYVLGYPLAMAIVKYPFLDTDAANLLLNVGVAASLTASSSILAGAASDLEKQDFVSVPVAAAVPLIPNTVTQWLTATLVSASGTIQASTALGKLTNPKDTGIDIWIYACLLPYKEWIVNRWA